jgi:hypothetical protein
MIVQIVRIRSRMSEDEEALAHFRQSELYRTIPTAYEVQGNPDVRTAEVVMTLRSDQH